MAQLCIWAKDKDFSANLTFERQNSHEILSSGEFSYRIRVHFESLDFLLRSKTIAKIKIAQISWDENRINSSQILSYEAQNRNLALNSTQPSEFFENLKGENLGVLTYKIGFSPFLKTILKYYFWIFLAVFLIFGIKNTLLSWRVLGENESLNLSKFDNFFLIFTALLCAGICAFTFWLGFPGYNWFNDATGAMSLNKGGWHPVFTPYVLEFLYFAFGRHAFYLFLFNIMPFYLGLFFIVAAFYIRTKSPFSLLCLFPTFFGEIYFANFIPWSNTALSMMIFCLYSMILFLVLVPLKSRILRKILLIFVFILIFFALLWRHNSIFSVFPAFFIIIYLWQRRNFSLKKYALFMLLSAILCLGVVKIVPKILEKGEAHPAVPMLLNQIAAACVPSADNSCFKEEWYESGGSFENVQIIFARSPFDSLAYIDGNFTASKKDGIEKAWIKAILKHPLNFAAYQKRLFAAMWSQRSNSQVQLNLEQMKSLVSIDGGGFEYNAGILREFPANEYRVNFTPLKERIYHFIFENKITLNVLIFVLFGLFVMVISAWILWKNSRFNAKFTSKAKMWAFLPLSEGSKRILIFTFSAAFASFGSAVFLTAFSLAILPRFMQPVVVLSLLSLFGFLAFLCEIKTHAKI